MNCSKTATRIADRKQSQVSVAIKVGASLQKSQQFGILILDRNAYSVDRIERSQPKPAILSLGSIGRSAGQRGPSLQLRERLLSVREQNIPVLTGDKVGQTKKTLALGSAQ